jgi:outer membrane lipoprotein SlyB
MTITLRIGAAAVMTFALGLQGCAIGTNSNSAYTAVHLRVQDLHEQARMRIVDLRGLRC